MCEKHLQPIFECCLGQIRRQEPTASVVFQHVGMTTLPIYTREMDTMSNIDWLFEGSVWSRHRCTSETWCASVVRLGFGATIRDRRLVEWQRVYRRAAVNEDVGRRLASH